MNDVQIKVYTKVQKFLDKIKHKQPIDYDRITGNMDIVKKVGIKKSLQGELIVKIKGHKEPIYELRCSGLDRIYRFMGTIIDNDMHLVHAFAKKDQKTRDLDIEKTKQKLKSENLI